MTYASHETKAFVLYYIIIRRKICKYEELFKQIIPSTNITKPFEVEREKLRAQEVPLDLPYTADDCVLFYVHIPEFQPSGSCDKRIPVLHIPYSTITFN